MEQGVRTVRYDRDLGLEGYRFQGIIQIFPGHFHEYYTLGFIEDGLQHVTCRDTDCLVESGDLLIFAPGEVHACRPVDGRKLDYRGLNVPKSAMERAAAEITGVAALPHFRDFVVFQSDLTDSLRALNDMVMAGEAGFRKEECFLLLLSQLLERYAGDPPAPAAGEAHQTVAQVCTWLEGHYAQHVGLDQLSELAGWSKYRLIRAFVRERGITPYSYLLTLRVGAAKSLLESGVSPLDAALECGFSDQSHFTNQFKKLIGLTPGQYGAIFGGGSRNG